MLRFKHQRAGLSLMEALVALFIMAIGMISLLTLFPLGAIQMGRALRDDRCAQCAWQGYGVVRTWWQVEVVDKAAIETNITAPYYGPLDGTVPKDSTTQSSMVVAIDPIGMNSGRSTQPLGNSGIVRKSSTLVPGLKESIRLCSLTDDVFFNELGQPDTVSGSVAGRVVRQGRYNWMALIQRPVNANRTTAALKILVFDSRAVGTFPANGEQLVNVTGAATGQTSLSIAPQGLFAVNGMADSNFTLAKGGWLLDATGGTRMDLYRVQSITPNGAMAIIELDTPIRGNPAPTQMIMLRGLAEVFDRPMLAPTGYLNPQP